MKTLLLFFLCSSLMTLSTPTRSDNVSIEMLQLMRLVKELDYLIAETNQLRAKRQTQMISFDYQVLLEDLVRIRALIRQHMVYATQSPNTLVPHPPGFADPVSSGYTRKQ